MTQDQTVDTRLDPLAILNAAPGSYLILLPDAPRFTIVGVTDAYLAATFIKREQSIGSGIFQTLTDNPANTNATGIINLSNSLTQVLESRRPHEMEDQRYDIYNPNTGEFEMRIWKPLNKPVLDSTGQVQYIIHWVEDVTEKNALKQQTRDALEISDGLINRWEKAMSIETVGIIYFDLDGGIHDSNAAFQRMSGYSKEAFTSGEVKWTALTPAEFMEATLKSREELLTSGQNTPYEKQYIRPDGTRWWGLFAGKRLSDKECVEFVVDITRQKQALEALQKKERNLREMIQQAPVPICIFRGPEFFIEAANKSMIEFWGKASREEVVNKPLFDALPEAKNQGYEELMNQVLETGESYSALELPVRLRRRGKMETVYVNINYEPLRSPEGNINGILAMAADVTAQVVARKKIEEIVALRTEELADANLALQNSNNELLRSNKSLEEFAYAASHDLKEPIRKINFYTNQLKQQLVVKFSENEVHSFTRIENSIGRMAKLVDDLLLYSHVNERPLEKEMVDLNAKLERVMEDLELDIAEKKAEIRIGSLPTVTGYRRQLQQLFQNLVSNALKYRKPDVRPRIDITAQQVEWDGKQYHLVKVKDNGIGFRQEYAEKIFQMFTRLHGNTKYGGTGVGLSIVKKVVENHEGFVKAFGEEGEGATFEIYLPV